ncbi:helix-turn-helix domain-containing protein [Brevibacillus laterosporus]|uniref:helix-turn-helix domain-containing protein n=1 Tax=Brevibacillus laterosporus TaxID=1465 RepID=UPI0014445942|nr:helix-turn-helix transcriptional regulator [Brevibacillus laterosporus]MCG7318040.1 helix-turn-helix domain-containing protein [Brevibacillus laterosporus]NKQ20526.1 helix-turn-helix domain-containing protein [Brevibacillus laterosporus]WNX32573.1 helix-turn-helix transcriptional regulator [Brevibacillus laterosporus]
MTYSVGKMIKGLRLKHGLSQEDLAEKLNTRFGSSINKGMISKWENGLGDPRLETVRHLSILFNVSLDYLLGLEKEEAEINTIAAHFEGEDYTEEELQEILDYAKYLKSKRK